MTKTPTPFVPTVSTQPSVFATPIRLNIRCTHSTSTGYVVISGARGKHRRDPPRPAMRPYPPESWQGSALGREIEPVLVRGGKLLIGFDTADEPSRLKRLKEGRIARVLCGGNGRRCGRQAMALL